MSALATALMLPGVPAPPSPAGCAGARPNLCLGCALVLALIVPVPLHAQSPEDPDKSLKERFLREAPRQWEEYCQSFLPSLQGTLKFTRSRNAVAEDDVVFSVKQNRSCTLFQADLLARKERSAAPWQGYIWGFNPRYAFSLGRKSTDAPWVLTQFSERSDDAATRLLERSLDGAHFLRDLVRIEDELLSDLVRQPAFRVTSVKTVRHRGSELVVVAFEHRPPAPEDDKPFFRLRSGTLTLDPRHCWCLQSCDVSSQYPGGDAARIHAESTYRESRSNARYPIPVRLTEQAEIAGPSHQPMRLSERSDYDLDDPAELPGDGEFTTLVWQIPEPLPAPGGRMPSRWDLWTGLGGIVCLCLGLGLRRLKRRPTVADSM